MHSIRQSIEQFHLLFLDQLGRKVDKRLYALKGGCNLRFYFQSMRYSEDLDFDIKTMRHDTLLKNVQGILESTPFARLLQLREITINTISRSKQTATTQRWKLSLKVANFKAHTKIEFSQRDPEGTVLFEAVDAMLTQGYHLPPILSSHYDRASAIKQKIEALASRTVTQARDIFDVYLLLSGNGSLPVASTAKKPCPATIAQALRNISAITYPEFRSQVTAFLAPEYQAQYAAKEAWQHIVDHVSMALSGGQDAAK